MEPTCLICDAEFERQTSGKGYKRMSRQAKLNSSTVKHLSVQDGLFLLGFPEVEGEFVCLACFCLLTRATRSKIDYEKFREELFNKRLTVKTEFEITTEVAEEETNSGVTVSTASSPEYTVKYELSSSDEEQSSYTNGINMVVVNSSSAQTDSDQFRNEVCNDVLTVKTEFEFTAQGEKRNRDKLTPENTPRALKKRVMVSRATSPVFTPTRLELSESDRNQGKVRGFKQRCYRALEQSNYTSAINIMLAYSRSARTAFHKVGLIDRLNIN